MVPLALLFLVNTAVAAPTETASTSERASSAFRGSGGVVFLGKLPGLQGQGRYAFHDHAGVFGRMYYFWLAGYLDAGLYVTTGRRPIELSLHAAPFATGGTLFV